MQVILLERIEKLGMMGQVVDVKPGFARNYLLPQKKALRATKDNVQVFEAQKKDLEAKNLTARKEAEFVAEKLEDVMVIIIRQAGESGQLYGSVSARDVVDSLKAKGVTVSRAQVTIEAPIKTLGIHVVGVHLHPELKLPIKVNVAQSVEEAEAKAKALSATQASPAAAVAVDTATES